MEVSKLNTEPQGHELIQKVIDLTGLPEELIGQEIDQILVSAGQNAQEQVTLVQLREALAAYLEIVHAELSGQEKTL